VPDRLIRFRDRLELTRVLADGRSRVARYADGRGPVERHRDDEPVALILVPGSTGEVVESGGTDDLDPCPRVRLSPARGRIGTRNEEQRGVVAIGPARVRPVGLSLGLAVRLTYAVLKERQRAVAEATRLLGISVARDERGSSRSVIRRNDVRRVGRARSRLGVHPASARPVDQRRIDVERSPARLGQRAPYRG
jgi:hypothetical protein